MLGSTVERRGPPNDVVGKRVFRQQGVARFRERPNPLQVYRRRLSG